MKLSKYLTIPIDKDLHFAYGGRVAAVAYLIYSVVLFAAPMAMSLRLLVVGFLAIVTSFYVGHLKEDFDENQYGLYDKNDLWVTGLGGIFQTLIITGAILYGHHIL